MRRCTMTEKVAGRPIGECPEKRPNPDELGVVSREKEEKIYAKFENNALTAPWERAIIK